MSTARDTQPEPNFARLVTEDDLASIEISAHALQRFVDRLQPGIPGAARAAQTMGRLEGIPSGTRTQRERNQLREHRDWLRAHVQPVIRDLLISEGFWATERPRWSQSRTPSDAHVQIGGLCYWPAARDPGQPGVTLTTCTNGRDITWDIALDRGYTLMPKPYTQRVPAHVKASGWPELIRRAWRTRNKHSGLLRALRIARTTTKEHAKRENQRAEAEHQTAKNTHRAQREHAQRTFRERHT